LNENFEVLVESHRHRVNTTKGLNGGLYY